MVLIDVSRGSGVRRDGRVKRLAFCGRKRGFAYRLHIIIRQNKYMQDVSEINEETCISVQIMKNQWRFKKKKKIFAIFKIFVLSYYFLENYQKRIFQ